VTTLEALMIVALKGTVSMSEALVEGTLAGKGSCLGMMVWHSESVQLNQEGLLHCIKSAGLLCCGQHFLLHRCTPLHHLQINS
jgi:hypothetical protein